MIYDGKFMLFSKLGYVLYEGTVTSITLKNYTAIVDVYKDGTKVDSGVTVTGTIRNETTFTGTLAGGTNLSSMGSFSLAYDVLYERGATGNRSDGAGFDGDIYYKDSIILNSDIQLRVSTQFVMTTNNSVDCAAVTASGYMIPSILVNIYQFNSFDIFDTNAGGTSCPVVSSGYTGMATVIDKSVENDDDKVIFAFTNGTISMFGVAER